MSWDTFLSKFKLWGGTGSISRNTINAFNYQYLIDQPAWLSLSNPSQYRQAVEDNPVLYGCIDILASAAANGKKYLTDLNGEFVAWDTNKQAVKNCRKLFLDRPNPLQSVREFEYERAYMFYCFGNNYVYLNNPSKTLQTDILTVQTLYNLPSEYATVKQTGKLYDQIDIKGIIEKYSLTNYNPAKEFEPDKVILFNEVNISNVGNSIIGTSRLANLKYPITNTQLAFEAMNVLLQSRGMQGIIKANNKDATGTQIPMRDEDKKQIERTFKTDYGIQRNQKQYLISYSDIDFIKTVMSPQELGIYDEFSNNAIYICNGLKVPHELYKVYQQGATYENQQQSVRNLYQNTVIPRVDNDDLYWTERLRLRDYGLELHTDFSHLPVMQDAFKEKAQALQMNVNSADKAYNQNLITWNKYLELMDMDPVDGGDIYKFERDKLTGNGQKETNTGGN